MIIRGSEKVLVQGITGKQGTFWSERMMEYGTQVIGGVNPKGAGETHLGRPVWGSAVGAAADTQIDASVLFIPPLGVKAAALDAIEAGIGKLVILTEHIPVQDVMYFMAAAREAGVRIAGPNTAGLGSRAAAASAPWSASIWCATASASRPSSASAATRSSAPPRATRWSRWTGTSAPRRW
jgi:succinyl-CoA synthetase alpha subunit